jgi:ribose transport system substrate-binding protein
LFTTADHPALEQAGEELGVRVSKAGPNSIDIPSLVAAIEQTAARRPTGMMIVGWDPSALVLPINAAIDAGVPVVCVDATCLRASGSRSWARTGTTLVSNRGR